MQKMDIHKELYKDIDRASPERLAFTRKAFECLPALDRPRILDAGCGNGDVTIELARLGGGDTIGIDINSESLGKFEKLIGEEGLGERVHALHGSMLDMPLPPEGFDIVWAEASIHTIGFEKGLEALRAFIRPEGFLVVHELVWIRPDPPEEILDRWKVRFSGILSIEEFKELIASYNFMLMECFSLPDDFWGRVYYESVGKRIEHLRGKYSDNPEALAILNGEQSEVDLYYESSRWFGSAFFVMQRNNR